MTNMRGILGLFENERTREFLMGFDAAMEIMGREVGLPAEDVLAMICQRDQEDQAHELERAFALAKTLNVSKETLRGMLFDAAFVNDNGEETDGNGNVLPEGQHYDWPLCSATDEDGEIYDTTHEEAAETGDPLITYALVETDYGTNYKLYADSLVTYALLHELTKCGDPAESVLLGEDKTRKKLEAYFGKKKVVRLITECVRQVKHSEHVLPCEVPDLMSFRWHDGKFYDLNGDIVTDEQLVSVLEVLSGVAMRIKEYAEDDDEADDEGCETDDATEKDCEASEAEADN